MDQKMCRYNSGEQGVRMMGRSLPDTPMICSCQATRERSWCGHSTKGINYMWVAMNRGRSYRIMSPRQQETLMQP